VFSPDGKLLATASIDQTIKTWDSQSGQEQLTLKGHKGAIQDFAFSPDGRRLASACGDSSVILWDLQNGDQRLVLRHGQPVLGVAFSPDGKRIATASRTIRLWDADDGQEVLTLKGHTGAIRSVAFSADGGRLLSTSVDKTARIWDASPVPQKLVRVRKSLTAIDYPAGWALTGSNRDGFEMGVDRAVHRNAEFASRAGLV